MSLEAALREHGGVSPPASGRSSPVPRAARRTVEDGLYKADKSLKRYAASIERALGSWEISPEEWADYIAFLARLLKAIQTHPKDAPFLPHSRGIATRLAQCLNPALPSGVHQKSLEVYTYIFSTFGNDYISSHLHEFLPGLSAVLSFASLSVRPALYDLFENHVVSLPPGDLRPALKSLILGLLPALEEETAEDFERAFNILRALESTFVPDKNTVDLTSEPDGYFWQCLFLAVITNPSRRQGALNYFVQQLPSLSPFSVVSNSGGKPQLTPAAGCVVSPEPGLLVRCFVCGLSDSQILIQRGFLDLLVSHLPLNSSVLQQMVGPDDLDRLISAATQVLLRRDMSLNRRLWSWFLGPEPKDQPSGTQPSSPNFHRTPSGDNEPSAQLKYFSRFGENSLQRCMLKMLHNSSPEPSLKARPYRICLSLMDRWEIGGLLVPKVFLPAMRNLHEYSIRANSDEVAEVVRSASLFFDGVEASLIWECLLGTVHEALERGQSATSAVDLFDWIINTYNIKDEEMQTVHIPQAIVYLATCLNSTSSDPATRAKIVATLSRLLEFVPERAFQSADRSKQLVSAQSRLSDENIRAAVIKFYRNNSQSGGKTTSPFPGSEVAVLLAAKVMQLLSQALEARSAELFANLATLLLAVLSKTDNSTAHEDTDLRRAFTDAFQREPVSPVPFQILQSIINLETLWPRTKPQKDDSVRTSLLPVESQITSHLWHYMSPERPKNHVEAVKAFWQLDGLISPNDAMMASMAALSRNISQGTESTISRAETARRFAVLWDHSISAGVSKAGAGRRSSALSVLQDSKQMVRSQEVLEEPLLLTLDSLNDTADAAFEVVKNWLQVLSSLEQVLQILFKHLLELSSLIKRTGVASIRSRTEHVQMMDYFLSHFKNIITHGSQWTRRTLLSMPMPDGNNAEGSNGLFVLADTSVALLCSDFHGSEALNRRLISVLEVLLSGSTAAELQSLDLDSTLLDRLMICINGDSENLQGGILRLVQLALKLRLAPTPSELSGDTRQRGSVSSKRPSIAPSMRPAASASSLSLAPSPPHQLFRCLRMGFSSRRTRYYLDQWLVFLGDILPTFADALFTNLLPLVGCFCEELAKACQDMERMSCKSNVPSVVAPESAAMSLLEGLEMTLDRAYECLLSESGPEPTPKDNDSKPNFLSNVTSGVFKAEGPPSRTSKSNSRLTVILALQDSIRVVLRMWLWASNPSDAPDFDNTSASTTTHIALRIRNKTRHLLEQIFSVEPLESLEVVMAHWSHAPMNDEASTALSLLHVMQVSRPKNVVPATLDALCSRTNPSAIPPARNSSLTIDLSPSDVATFFSAYLESTEDDAIDELWPDCIAFLRDVLANPLPYRQVLPHFLSIILLLSEKLNNTNFGEQRKMRRDLGDIFQRLLMATFTTLPSGYVAELATDSTSQNGASTTRRFKIEHSFTFIAVLNRVVTRLELILETQERMAYAVNNITQNLLSPVFRSKSFPRNISQDVLALVVQMTRKAPGAKTWKKEVTDAFNDSRLLASSPELMSDGWFQVLHQWSLHDKERMPELLSRLAPPSSAGIMFGVGASAARQEADRRTQLNLRRLCVLLLASPEDTYVAHLRPIEEKISELFEASPSSSPSAVIKAELFMLCRTLTLSISSVHMSPFWPIINDKLEAALTSLLPNGPNSNDFNNLSILQGCKLLDLLVSLSPDEFQLHEWLYITDTIDAVYQSSDFSPVALSDQIAETLGSTSLDENMIAATPTGSVGGTRGKRRPLLGDELNVDKEDIKALPKEEFVRAVIRPFLSQLSMHAYEGVYSMEQAETKVLREGLLEDLLDLGSVVE